MTSFPGFDREALQFALHVRLKAAGVVYKGDVIKGPHCRMSNILDSEGNGIILHELDR